MIPLFFRLLRFAFAGLLLGCGLCANSQEAGSAYDKKLADSLGSDEYGMKRYVLAVLKTGSSNNADKLFVDSVFRGHMENIKKLVEQGKLIIAGPLQKNERSYRGIFVFNVPSIDEAKALVDTDPAVRARLLDSELYAWYGSAALPMYLQFHDRIQKTRF